MRLHFDFSEYDETDDPSRVMVTVNIPDGSSHTRITEIYEKTVSMFMGYDVGHSLDEQFEFDFDDEDEFKACPNCVQGTCMSFCGREFP